MGGGGLLIFYVTNETNETNVRPSFWAYLPNNLPKNVVPLQRNFKTLQYHESPNIAVKGATQPKEIPPNCSFQLPLLR